MKFDEAKEKLKDACEVIGGEFTEASGPINFVGCRSPSGDKLKINTDFDIEEDRAKQKPVIAGLVSEEQSEAEIEGIDSMRAEPKLAILSTPEIRLYKDGNLVIRMKGEEGVGKQSEVVAEQL